MSNTTDTDSTPAPKPVVVPTNTTPSGGLIARLTRPADTDDED